MGNQRVLGLHLVFLSMLLVATENTSLGAQNSTRSCHEQERQALLEFKHSIKDECGVLSSWAGTNCCSWKGVRCDGATGNVVGLHLRRNQGDVMDYTEECYLEGDKVNTYLAKLRHLKHLDLSRNDFQGSQIPEFIGSFKQLSYLNLSDAGFSIIIPHHIGNLSKLKVLDLGSYYYFPQGLIVNDVAWVSSLSSLDHLDLSYVNLSQAKNIDIVFHIIPSLTYLSLSECGLSDVDLGLHLNSSKILPNIQHLDLGFNNFEGQLPHFLQNMTSLTFLDLSWYNLSLAWNSLMVLNTIQFLTELHLSDCRLQNAHFSPTYFNISAYPILQCLDLSRNSIGGRFPSELMNMTSLRVLDLRINNLNSSIPVMPNLLELDVSFNMFDNMEHVGIWRWCHLKELLLSSTHFGGEMTGPSPNMSECSQYALETFYLDKNNLNGSIPEFLGSLTNLRVLQLSENSFTSSIPEALERLRSLEVLDLSYNHINGSIPESFGRLPGLTSLNLQSNRLTGAIPTSLGRLDSLQTLSVASNLLTGPIPVSLGQLTKLVDLDLSENSLEGVVFEAHFANLSMLNKLQTPSNYKLIFNISHDWKPPFQLRMINFRSCKILNGFPKWLQTQRKLEVLVLSNASIHGVLPISFRKMPKLSELDLSYNKFSGSLINLPFSEYTDILLLQDNHFSGSLPTSLCRSTHLSGLDVSRNRLSGNIPDCVRNLQNLHLLVLSSNRLSGALPSSLGYLSSSLTWLKLNDNNFNGELPRDLETLRFLTILDLGNNEFSGNIPRWIGENLTDLVILRLHKNNFTGGIPRSFCKLSHLHILDIAHNNLIGSIPHCFKGLSGMTEARQDDFFIDSYDHYVMSQTINMNQVMKGMDLKYTHTTAIVFNMDLSSNELTGEIPPDVTALSLLIGLFVS